ncbi:MAG: M48 family metallopeptidase [Pseudobdellovibrionaceae bacterium]
MRWLYQNSSPARFDTLELPKDVQLRHSKRSTRLALRLNPKKRVIELVVPPRATTTQARLFLNSHQDWIAKTLSSLPQSFEFAHGSEMPLFGSNMTLFFDDHMTGRGPKIRLEEGILRISSDLNEPQLRLKRFIKAEMKALLTRLSIEKAQEIDKTVASVTVRDTSSRWGSCSPDGHLSYSWRLAFAPYDSIDYVVAHEVAHLVHMDHSANFWNLTEKLSKDYKKGKGWMRNHASELMRYQF